MYNSIMFHDFLQTSVHGFNYYLVTWGFMETFLLSGHRAGWASLVFVLKKDGIYQYLCPNSSSVQHSLHTLPSNHSLNVTPTFEDGAGNGTISPIKLSSDDSELITSCPQQDVMFELCVTIASVLSAPFSLLMSQLNFSMGMRITRIVSISLLLVGAISFGFISTECPWLIFIGYICVSNGGFGILQTNIQISYMFAKRGSTVVGAICGAFDASGAVYLVVKLAYGHGIPLSTSFFVIGCSVFMAVISTFFLLPKDFIWPVQVVEGQVPGTSECRFSQKNNSINTNTMSEETNLINRTRLCSVKDHETERLQKSLKGRQVEEAEKSHGSDPVNNGSCGETKNSLSVLLQYMCSPRYILFTVWMLVNQLLYYMFEGSLNAWLSHVTHSVEERVSHFTNFVYSVMLSAPIFSVLSGTAVDFLDWIQSDSRNPKAKTVYSLAGLGTFTTMTGVLLCACVITEKEEVTYTVSVLSVVFRSALFCYLGAFVRVLYPTDFFGALYGVVCVLSGTVTFLQYPLFLWCQSTDNGYRQVYSMFGLATLCSFVQPFYLIYTGWKQTSA